MAQQRTKKKRNPKNRGNAAGVVTRRAGNKQAGTQAEGKQLSAQAKKDQRLNSPPTWRGALNRAAIAAAIFAVLNLLLFKQKPVAAISLAAVMLLVYVPMSYYTDLFFYRRRQRNKLS